ncbi:MAG: hypothetical protein R3E39_12560 [Anaerolineae bacterium]
MFSSIPSRNEFLNLPSEDIHDLIYDRQISISLLLNGTRRWYLASHYDAPPSDTSYFPHYLEMVLLKLSELLTMLAEHGVYRVFIPVYSWYQPSRNPEAHKFLLRGIQSLVSYPGLVEAYTRSKWGIRFYGDTSHFPDELATLLRTPPPYMNYEPQGYIYYGVDVSNPYNHTLRLAHEFSQTRGIAAKWEDMLEAYYGDRRLKPLDILIGFNRIYSKMGIPHLLEGWEIIYVTVVTPLVLSEFSLRTILHDFLQNRHDIGRDYKDIHPNEIQRLKQFYAANANTILGLTQKYEDLVYPLPTIQWPDMMNNSEKED